MRTNSVLWIVALVLTLAAAVYQRVTGPSYPVRGTVTGHGSVKARYQNRRLLITGTVSFSAGGYSMEVDDFQMEF